MADALVFTRRGLAGRQVDEMVKLAGVGAQEEVSWDEFVVMMRSLNSYSAKVKTSAATYKT